MRLRKDRDAKRNEFGFMCVIPAGIIAYMALLFTGVHGGDVWESSGSAGHDGVPGSLWGAIGIGWHILQIKI